MRVGVRLFLDSNVLTGGYENKLGGKQMRVMKSGVKP